MNARKHGNDGRPHGARGGRSNEWDRQSSARPMDDRGYAASENERDRSERGDWRGTGVDREWNEPRSGEGGFSFGSERGDENRDRGRGYGSERSGSDGRDRSYGSYGRERSDARGDLSGRSDERGGRSELDRDRGGSTSDRGPGGYAWGMSGTPGTYADRDYGNMREARYGGDRDRDGGIYGSGGYGSGSSGYGGSSYGSSAGDEHGDWGRTPYAETRQGKGPKGYTRSDERLKEEICDRLEASGADWSDVDVQVSGGEVTLTGTVGDRRTKFDGEHVAAGVRGVKDVHNQLRIKREGASASSSSRSDSQKNDAASKNDVSRSRNAT